MADLIIGPALGLGLIIGAYEAIIVHRDVNVPTHRFMHMIHALILSVIFVFATMNTKFVFELIPALANIPVLGNIHIFHIAIGVLAAIKIHGSSRVIQRSGAGMVRGMSETWFHSLLIGGLIVAAPYVYPFIENMLPQWIKF